MPVILVHFRMSDTHQDETTEDHYTWPQHRLQEAAVHTENTVIQSLNKRQTISLRGKI